ncbi:MAG: hypothetical protein DMF64_17720 [Acidobacteria bacterium]|nr:MAG: hypothetical protein DMF64_17720 [Acidobacteriota bacterium]
MLLDWQNIAVLLIVLAACVYVGRRGWARLRSFQARRAEDAGCATGCGSCGSEPRTLQPQAKLLIQLGREKQKAEGRRQ